MLEPLIDLFWPPRCAACDRILFFDTGFCAECEVTIEPLPAEHCSTCAEPGHFEFGRCLRCLERPPPFCSTITAFTHGGAMARAIHRFKYEDHPELVRPLAEVWVKAIRTALPPKARLVVPLPLHRSRFHARRYDQTNLLARELATRTRRLVLPVLRRTRKTSRQVGLSEKEREANVSNAFIADERVAGRRVLLVDDVLTTGATARAAAWALLHAGAREVHLVILARAYTL